MSEQQTPHTTILSSSAGQSALSQLSAGRRWLLSSLAIGAIIAFSPGGRTILATGLWLLAPGYLLERLLPGARLHWLLRIALWIGISASIIPLIYLWITAANGHLEGSVIIVGAILLAAGAIIAAWRDLAHLQVQPSASAWLLIGVLAITAWLRAEQIADLALPAWVDSVHHALMIRVAAETGRAPWTLTPYLPVVDMPYHWGYHVVIAAIWRTVGGELTDVMLWSGQMLNWLQSLTAAALALLCWRRPSAAVVAAAVVGCISWMPAYYVSWGRYTQLSGLLLLVALAIGWQYWLTAETRRERLVWLGLVTLVIAGLSLIHMRIFVFGGALIVAQSIVWAIRQSRSRIVAQMTQALLAGVVAIALAAPWWLLLLRRVLLPAATGAQSLTSGGSYVQLNRDLMWIGPNEWLVALALISGALGIAYRQRATTTILLWIGGLILLTNPWLVSYLCPPIGIIILLFGIIRRAWLPGGAGLLLLAINPFTVRLPFLWLLPVDIAAISLFLPLSSLIGGGAALIWPTRHRLWRISGTMILIGLCFWGADQQRAIVNPVTVLATAADRAAIAWIKDHTPPNARFLVNAAPWLPGVARGNDGGWWITPLTGRWMSTPPALFVYGDVDAAEAARRRSQQIIDFGNGQPIDLDHLITTEQIDYIYTSAAGPLQPELFADKTGYEPVFAQDGIVIYRTPVFSP
ncbi:hypothetical protein [Chloroflexus sp.]|uniref:hypothetical protein n=1 Tax=Chloroflexus sp. TaxID=1904827 RepID=UPI00262C7565|nr:hypothetical protein [uncultured Chloroflexus sp.]